MAENKQKKNKIKYKTCTTKYTLKKNEKVIICPNLENQKWNWFVVAY